jgi:tetratricopeptide (TPR) repeat protein
MEGQQHMRNIHSGTGQIDAGTASKVNATVRIGARLGPASLLVILLLSPLSAAESAGGYAEQIRAFREADKLDAALALANRAVAAYPSAPEVYLERAYVLWERQQFDRAIPDVDQAIRLNPALTRPYVDRAALKRLLGKLDAAQADLDRAFATAPTGQNLGRAWGELANLLEARGAPSAQIIAAYDKAIAASPNSPTPYAYRSDTKATAGDGLGALQDADTAIRLSKSDYPRFHFFRGKALYKLRRRQEAIVEFTRALQPPQAVKAARVWRGWARNSLEQFAGAVEDLTGAEAEGGLAAEDYEILGNSELNLKHYAAAIKALDKALSLKQDLPLSYLWRAYARVELGDRRAAYRDYEQAFEAAIRTRMDETDKYWMTEIRYHHGWVLMQKGDLAGGIADLKEAIALDPKHYRARRDLGLFYWQAREYKKGVESITNALRLDAKEAFAFYLRGLCHRALGSASEAKADFEKALTLHPSETLGRELQDLLHGRTQVSSRPGAGGRTLPPGAERTGSSAAGAMDSLTHCIQTGTIATPCQYTTNPPIKK